MKRSHTKMRFFKKESTRVVTSRNNWIDYNVSELTIHG